MADGDQAVGDKSWNINHYILAGLCATLFISAVVTIASVVLSPPQVTFSVARATTRKTLSNATTLTLTIAVDNPSRRCQARYQSVFINLKNTSTAAGRFSVIRSNVEPSNTFPMRYVRGPNVTLVRSTVKLLEDGASGLADRVISGANFTVEVRAEVRFKIGVTPTRLYDMTVSCPGVHFIRDDGDDDSSTAGANDQQNFTCSG